MFQKPVTEMGDDQIAGLIAALSPAGHRRLAGEIAKQLRTVQQQQIKQQKAPDGSPYQARKHQPLTAKMGRIKRAMFHKLRTSRYMKGSGRENTAVLEFTGKVQRTARVHQFRLKEWPSGHFRMCNTRSVSYSVSIRTTGSLLRIYLISIQIK